MKYLVANYDLELEIPILIKWPNKSKPMFEVEIKGFKATLEMATERHSASKKKGEKNWSVPYTHFVITIAREDEPPPQVIPSEDGTRDYAIQSGYFKERTIEFGDVAVEVTNRALRYFKYRLWQPLLVEIEHRNHFRMNPRWTDENGVEVGKGTGYFRVKEIPAVRMREFGVVKFEKKHSSSFIRYLEAAPPYSLRDEIVSDAQSAICTGNYRRAVLELALSIEILIKQTIFGNESYSGLAFEYLEDKGKVNIRVLELIDNVALQIFGSSFKNERPTDFKNIDYLFRSRNKVAHRGEAIYKDDTGKLHIVDLKILMTWWKAVVQLQEWLQQNIKNKP